MTRERQSTLLVLGALTAIALAAYLLPVCGGATFVGRDHLSHTLPAKQYLAESLRDGRLPQWWDAVDLGVPFAANPNHSALYPPAWVLAVLPLPWGIDMLLVAHVLFAGIGMALLARRFGARTTGQIVAGTAFMLSGFVTSTVVHGGPLLTLAWIPWCAEAADRLAAAPPGRPRALAALRLAALVGAQLLAGDPSFVIVGNLVVLAIVLARASRRLPSLAYAAAAMVGGCLLAAVVIVPALLLLGHTMRGDLDSAAAQTWSMHPLRIFEWLVPGILGDPNTSTAHLGRIVASSVQGEPGLPPAWALGTFVGLPAIAFAVVGWQRSDRQTRWLGAAIAVFVLLALGRYTPIYPVFRTVFPPEHFVRYPEKYLCGALVLACALAGRGATELCSGEAWSKRLMRGLAATGGGYLVLIGVVLALGRQIVASVAETHRDLDVAATFGYMRAGATSSALAVLIVGAGLALTQRKRYATAGAMVVIASLALQQASRVWTMLPLVDRDLVTRPPALLAKLGRAEGTRLRIHRPRQLSGTSTDNALDYARRTYATAIQNTSSRFGFADVPGYDQAHARQLQQVYAAASRRWMLAIYGVELAILPETIAGAEGMRFIARDEASGAVLVGTPAPRPRAFVTSRWRWVETDPDLLAARFAHRDDRPDPDSLATVFLLGRGAAATDPAPGLTPCAVHRASPERVSMHCEATAPGYAVLLDTAMPGWSATVDGQPARIEVADGMVRAVAVAAGAHEIGFLYAAPGLALSAIASGVAWLVWIGLAIALRVRRRTSAGAVI